MIGIYQITNLFNNKKYYGSSLNIEKRWKRHKNDFKNNTHNNAHLMRAWKKYGESNFIFEVVKECSTCDKRQLLELEQSYLDLKPEYNIGQQALGGDNLTYNPNKNRIIKKMIRVLKSKMSKLSDQEKKKKWSKPMELNPNWKGGVTYCYCKCGKRKQCSAKTCGDCRDRTGKNNPFYNQKHNNKTIKLLSKLKKSKYYGKQNKPIIINDVEYFSLGVASKKLGIKMGTIRHRIISKNIKFQNYRYK